MTDPAGPLGGASERRARERRNLERRKVSPSPALVLATVPAPVPDAAEPVAEAAFTAQVLGQSGQKRGLKGGPPVLEQARSAYLGAAYSGPNDRRPPPGRVTKTEI